MKMFSHFGLGLFGLLLANVALAPDLGGDAGPVPLAATTVDPPNGDYVSSDNIKQTSALPATGDTDAHAMTGNPATHQLGDDGGHSSGAGQMSG